MRVIVDETLCEANGFCESLVPDIFEIGKADVVHVADGEIPEHLEIDVRAAAGGLRAADLARGHRYRHLVIDRHVGGQVRVGHPCRTEPDAVAAQQ